MIYNRSILTILLQYSKSSLWIKTNTVYHCVHKYITIIIYLHRTAINDTGEYITIKTISYPPVPVMPRNRVVLFWFRWPAIIRQPAADYNGDHTDQQGQYYVQFGFTWNKIVIHSHIMMWGNTSISVRISSWNFLKGIGNAFFLWVLDEQFSGCVRTRVVVAEVNVWVSVSVSYTSLQPACIYTYQ